MKTCTHKALKANVHKSIIHNSQKSIKRSSTNKQTKYGIPPNNGMLSSNTKEQNTDSCYNINEPHYAK